MNPVRTRFAPSPTGSLHVGNARLAVLNWLFARRHGGAFLLRIEDTDVERNVPGSESEMLEDLRWLGLPWDEGPGMEEGEAEGPHSPYRQSGRGPIYEAHAHRLLDAGLAYPCYCTSEEIEDRRRIAIERGAPAHYDGTCSRLTADERQRLEREGRRAAIRFRVRQEQPVVVRDAVRGEVSFAAAEIGDFILLRSDGLPTYNFAVVVDDALMEITHVIRGVGHLSNTPRQVLLYEAFGWTLPVFAHTPTVLGPDRHKLSKRHGARALADYRRDGYPPEAMLNYLSLLAWSSPTGEEFLTRQQLIEEISLERIGQADVVFDEAKLRWLAGRHLEVLDADQLAAEVSPYVDRERFPIAEDVLPAAVAAVRTHISALADINDHLAPFLGRLDEAGIAARDDFLREDGGAGAVLRAAHRRLGDLEPWEQGPIDQAVRLAGQDAGVRGRGLFEPVRLALMGRSHGPPLPALLYVMGRATALRLLADALAAGPGL